jgi:uncharacterized membrane protein
MSELASDRSGSWARAWIAGAFAPYAIGMVFCISIDVWRFEQSQQDFADWAPGIPPFMMLSAALAAMVALFFVFLVRFAERRAAKPLQTWLALGLVAATPFALLFVGFIAAEPFDRATITVGSYLIPPIYLYVASLIGALTAWRVRRGARQA